MNKHKSTIIVNVDNDTCAYIDGKLYAGNMRYISFDTVAAGKPHLLYAVDERIPDNGADMNSFIYLLRCILQGWDTVESAQPKALTWFEALKQLPFETFAEIVFCMCQEKGVGGFKARLSEKFPEDMAPGLHLMATGALSLIPGYTPLGSNSSRLDGDT